MTGPNGAGKGGRSGSRFRLPDPPEWDADHAAAVFDALYRDGAEAELLPLLGDADSTLIAAGRYVIPHPGADTSQIPYHHLMIARNVDVALVETSETYVISEQGKPPDWVMMLARDSIAEANLGPRRDFFESLGVPEYWLLDHRGEYYGAPLIGYRLVNGHYEDIEIVTRPDGSVQGYSPVLGIFLRWTGEYLTYIGPESDWARAAESRIAAAEANIRELQEEVRRLRGN